MGDDWFLQFLSDTLSVMRGDWNGLLKGKGYINEGMDLITTEEDKNKWRYEMSQFPVIGDFYRWQDQQNYWSDYMDNRGLTWSDVKYPTMMYGSGTSSGAIRRAGAMLNPILSKNLASLYETTDIPFTPHRYLPPAGVRIGGRVYY